ncbi:histone-fold-containing protein [Xylaria bambusicola]|uniref:histone-fold-containing protein n=1 Tax=Xylaria bambusicola TaxID=326684 RepID=UPI002007B176|nr:histone-fold-containing protein [Xylaria bambusicola]KAI0506445.1 histone-fold-containing protein [Xylaria bambusicola]
MAPKKIDPAKRGDLSMAQFVYDGDLDRSETATAVPLQLKNTTPSTSTPATQMEMDGPAETSLLGEKDKEKDKEKKEKEKDTVTIEDLTLPKSIITRLAKGVLPSNTQIQANAILAMSKSATIFINHIANAANEHTLDNNKKTIMPGDVFAALEDIEFPFFRERLEAEFKKFNDTQTTKRNTYRRKVAAQKKAQTDGADPNTSLISIASTAADSDAAPRSKKQKPNAAHEESAMDVDGDETQEPRDVSDADTEPEQEPEEDEEDEENVAGEEEEDDEDEEEENDDEMHDRLEERPNREDDDDDDALDNDGDSD